MIPGPRTGPDQRKWTGTDKPIRACCDTDIDHAETLFLVGHNVAETQTVLWSRMLDRLHGPDRPRLAVVDPRETAPAREADVHLPIRNGTNLALMNGILHEVIANDWVYQDYVDAHTVGFAELEATVREYPLERVSEICGVEPGSIREAARLVGTAERLVSTALQGVYQSWQATASACQLNNLHLIRGQLGRPGCAVFQMNGQPTAQNTREAGADGDLPGFRNWDNEQHVQQLADVWNVDRAVIPHWAPPTHAMAIAVVEHRQELSECERRPPRSSTSNAGSQTIKDGIAFSFVTYDRSVVAGSGSPKSDGERLVAAYLRQRNFNYLYESEVRGRNLDFVVSTPADCLALEVYEPELRLPNKAGAVDSIEPVEGVFAQRKLKQIKAAKEAGMPLILVIGSANSDIRFGQFSVEGVMFGRPGVRMPLGSSDPGGEAAWTFLGPGRIQPTLNRGVSALALVRRFNPTKWRLDAAWRAQKLTDPEPAPSTHALGEMIERMATIERELADRGVYDREAALARLILFHNPHAIHPLDPLFAGPHDDQHGVVWLDDERAAWGRIASGVRRQEVPD